MYRYLLLLISLVLPTEPIEASPGDELDQQVASIFQAKCSVCHDNYPGAGAGNVDNLLDFLSLSDPRNGYFDSDAAQSYLAILIQNDEMPKRTWKDGIRWSGALTEIEKARVLRWIRRGGPSEAYREDVRAQTNNNHRELITERMLVESIGNDLLMLRGAQLKNARYLTLSNLHNCADISDNAMEQYRQAVVKMLNSLSRSSDVIGMPDSKAGHKVVAIDPSQTIYRFDLRHVGWDREDWEDIVKHYPYALVQDDGLGKSVRSLTDSPFPFMRADWFVFATSQAPLYHELLGIEEQLSELDSRLGVSRKDNIRNFQVARAGFAMSRVSVNNRLIERHVAKTGYYYISYDFQKNDGRANIFDFPLGPNGALDTKFSFQHDGGEVIFRLPNGFQAYVLVDGDGSRINVAPSVIVHDRSMPSGAILNGISCISCHYEGMKPENQSLVAKLDEVRQRSSVNFRTFPEKDRQQIEQLFPTAEKFGEFLNSDRESFQVALAKAGIAKHGATEPVRALFDAFVRNLDLNVAAAEFGLAAADFEKRLEQEGETRQLLWRLKDGGIQRQLFIEEFRNIARLCGLGTPRDFKKLGLPFFGQDSAQSDPVESTQDLLTAENIPQKLSVTIGDARDRTAFRDGETIPCKIKANQDCFITVLSVGPSGEIVSLLPNQWKHRRDNAWCWSDVFVLANRTIEISADTMGFEFFAQPPHGVTKLRVIASKEPLKLRFSESMFQQLRTKGLPILGYAKAAGVRPVDDGRIATPRPEQALTEKPIHQLFKPNDWATAEWTFTTRPRD